MKKILRKVFMPIFLSVICGSICGKLVYDIYDKDIKEEILGEKIYLLQIGAYSTYENMVNNTLINNYIYYEDNDGLYKAIIGITEDEKNIEKIKNTYGKEVIISQYYSKNKELNKKIKEYDKIINKTNNKEEIQATALEMLSLYKDNDDKTLVKIST